MDPFSIGWQQNDGKRAWRWIENQRCIDDLCSGVQNTSITLAFGLIHVNYRRDRARPPGGSKFAWSVLRCKYNGSTGEQRNCTTNEISAVVRHRPKICQTGIDLGSKGGGGGGGALILEGAGSSSWFALEFVRLQHGPPVSTQINWDPLCRSKDTSLMFYSARFRNVWRIARTFNINAQRNSNWNFAFFNRIIHILLFIGIMIFLCCLNVASVSK